VETKLDYAIFQNQTVTNKYLIYIFVGLLFFIIFSLILAKIWPWGPDLYYDFYPLAKQWLGGHHNIYDVTVSKLLYPPWSLFVIVPLGLLPIQLVHGFLLSTSFVLILFSLRLLNSSKTLPIYFIFLSLLNLHSFDLYIRGQLDAFVLFGIALGFWAIENRKPTWLSLGFCFMVMKPPLNVSLTL